MPDKCIIVSLTMTFVASLSARFRFPSAFRVTGKFPRVKTGNRKKKQIYYCMVKVHPGFIRIHRKLSLPQLPRREFAYALLFTETSFILTNSNIFPGCLQISV